jgi:2-polyprenyl-3-methyl-5-hydroxy-6-metoxy-1,4-benzoquinol methylase
VKYSIDCSFGEGYFESVSFERCGLIRLEGWVSNNHRDQIGFPKCFVEDEEIKLFQSFRIYRPDVAAALGSDDYFQGLTFEYRLLDLPVNHPRNIRLSFSGKTIFEQRSDFQVSEPAYPHLLDTDEVLHREHIYGYGPPSTTVIDEVFQLARTLPGPILDFGCGSGALVKRLRDDGIEAYGIELERTPILESLLPDVKDFVQLYQGGFPLPYKTGEFQSVIATEVVEHVSEYEAALSELARVARHRFTITVPDISSIPICHHNNIVPWHLLEGTHVNFFTQASLERLLRKYFLDVESARICPNTTNESCWFASLVGICRKGEE